jgi:hypothetical protein
LKPVAPWYGKSFGIWPEEDEALAALAKQGDFAGVQERIIRTGKKPH